MPNRIIRDWTDSDRFDGLSADAERLFVRLLMKADDYGRFHAEPRRLKAALFPLVESLRSNDLTRWLDELASRQLILRYESQDNRQLLAIPRFGQRLKQSVPKFPPPPGQPANWLPPDGMPSPDSWNDPEGSGDFPEVPARDGDGDGDDCGDGDGSAPLAGTPAIVVAAYHALLPDCRRVGTMTPKRRKRILAAEKLAKQVCRQQGWEYEPDAFWNGYFGACQSDPWRAGKVGNPKNESWRQNLDVLIREDHFAAIMDEAIDALKEAA